MLAVIATSSVVIAVFFPIAFLKGTIGQFFREFGLSVCFAMAVSLFEALVMGPMLSAYLGKRSEKQKSSTNPIRRVLDSFQKLLGTLTDQYEAVIVWCLTFPAAKVLSDARTGQFGFWRRLFARVGLIHSERLIQEVQWELKNGYSFSPLLSFLVGIILLILGALKVWQATAFIALIALGFMAWDFFKEPIAKVLWSRQRSRIFYLGLVLSFSALGKIFLTLGAILFLVQWVAYVIVHRHYLFAHLFYDHRWRVLLGAGFIFIFSVIGLGPHIKSTFLPSSDVGEFVVQLKAAPGTSLE